MSLLCVQFDMNKGEHKSAAFLAKNPLGKVPVLETPHGCLFESGAIARYVARLRNDTPGTIVKFTVKRGSETKDVSVTLKDLI